MPQHLGVTAVVLGTGDREAVTEAVELLGINGKDRKAALQQHLDHRSARRLDRHRDLCRLRSRRFQQPIAQLQQPGSAMRHVAFGYALALGIEQADTMLLRCPIEANKPTSSLIYSPPSITGHRDARRSLYGRSRRKPPTGHPSRPLCRGTCPTLVLAARGGQWWLPAD